MPEPTVVHVVPALFGPDGVVGGAERYALELARAMAARVPTSLVTFGDEARIERVGGLDVHVLGSAWYVRGQRSNPVSWRLLQHVRRSTVVHCHQQHIVASSLTALVRRLTGRKVFVSDLGGGGWDISGYVSTDHWYDGHLHISEYSRRVFGHAQRRDAHVVLGGVDVERFSPAHDADIRYDVAYVGRILPHKGIDYLIDALPVGLRLAVVGNAPDTRYLRDLETRAAGREVTFRHDVSDDELVLVYRSARCVALPSVYTTMYGTTTRVPELLGQTLLEGMACGRPALATDVASLPEVVENGVSGFLVPPNDPAALRDRLLRLRDDPDLADRMGGAARRRVLDVFTWDKVVDRCLTVYGTHTGGRA